MTLTVMEPEPELPSPTAAPTEMATIVEVSFAETVSDDPATGRKKRKRGSH